MTLAECEEILDVIRKRVDAIDRRWNDERHFDDHGIRDLRDFCRKKYPTFKGRYGNVGSKVSWLAEEASTSLRGHNIASAASRLQRGVQAMEISIALHRPRGD